MSSDIDTQIESLIEWALLEKIKVVGDGEFTLYGVPDDLIKLTSKAIKALLIQQKGGLDKPSDTASVGGKQVDTPSELLWINCGVCGETKVMGVPRNTEAEVSFSCSICQIELATERGEEMGLPFGKMRDIDINFDVKRCINPDHLFLGTQSDNMKDMVSKGRQRGTAYENAQKQYCKRGHEFTEENTRINSGGGRVCRTCDKKRLSKYKATPTALSKQADNLSERSER